jgi:hypothetical protein
MTICEKRTMGLKKKKLTLNPTGPSLVGKDPRKAKAEDFLHTR